jgi:hypothetical protein
VANQHRGQTPFRALGREMYLVYGVRELSEAWTALGFRRADPLAPPVAEERDDPVIDRKTGDPVKDEAGLPKFVRRRLLLDAGGRQARAQEAFDTVFTNPDIPARRTCLRIGLKRWQADAGVLLAEKDFEQIEDELGLEGLSALHIATWINASRVPPAESGQSSEGRDPNAPSAEPASSTSRTS